MMTVIKNIIATKLSPSLAFNNYPTKEMAMTKPSNKNKPKRIPKLPPPLSKASNELLQEGLREARLSHKQRLALQPLEVLCEALGLEMIVAEVEPKSKPSLKKNQ